MKEKGAKFLPHTAGRYAVKRFRKAQVQCSLYQFETLVCLVILPGVMPLSCDDFPLPICMTTMLKIQSQVAYIVHILSGSMISLLSFLI